MPEGFLQVNEKSARASKLLPAVRASFCIAAFRSFGPRLHKSIAPNVLLYKDEFFGRTTQHEMTPEFVANIDRKNLYVYGYVDYIDQFHRRYRSGYARQYFPDSGQ